MILLTPPMYFKPICELTDVAQIIVVSCRPPQGHCSRYRNTEAITEKANKLSQQFSLLT